MRSPGFGRGAAGLAVAGALVASLSSGIAWASGSGSGGNPADAGSTALAYVQAHYPGSGTGQILKTEPDVDRGVAVYDVRTLAPNGTIYVVHVQQSNDAVLWVNTAERQNSGTTPGGSGGSTDQANATNGSSPDAADRADSTSGSSGGSMVTAHISLQQAVTAAEGAVSNQAGVKKERLHNQDGKDYYQIKLRLQPHGTTNVWVDASTTTPIVTAIQGHGYHTRDSQLVTPSTADANALQAVGGGTVVHTGLHGGKWRFYEVKVHTTSGATEKVWESAVTGAVTQVKAG